jgi:5'-3' exonuclease
MHVRRRNLLKRVASNFSKMGIPSYFSYIIKNHVKIVRAMADTGRIHHLFMDCNSIIYDAVHKLFVDQVAVDEDVLIELVIEKIQHYVDYIRPTKTLYIAFDGVAPLAKMDQQRTRRHKTLWTSPPTTLWSTSHITPGTAFMQSLSVRVAKAFETVATVETVVVSGSTDCGEGEHKLFQHIRKLSKTVEENAAVYGLDSDLIMLSLFHCQFFKKLYVFRETPEFVKSQIACYSSDPCHFLDIDHLATAILTELGHPKTTSNRTRIYDYVFMCFFLGNDFLPHFPSLNLRTHGLPVLLEAYRAVFGKGGGGIVDVSSNTIVWSQVQRFVQHLAKQEMELWKQEYEVRAKWGNRQWSTANDKDLDFLLQNAPVIYRAEEMYIAPDQFGWESRYYKALFPAGVQRSRVCQNYLDGLAWVFQYYTKDCVNWRWKYEYDYPPLLCDLAMTSPKELTFMQPNPPFLPSVQLAYVTPQPLHDILLEPAAAKYLAEHHADLFVRPVNAFQWAFCRYFWESHVVLPEISMATMEKWTMQFKH